MKPLNRELTVSIKKSPTGGLDISYNSQDLEQFYDKESKQWVEETIKFKEVSKNGDSEESYWKRRVLEADLVMSSMASSLLTVIEIQKGKGIYKTAPSIIRVCRKGLEKYLEHTKVVGR